MWSRLHWNEHENGKEKNAEWCKHLNDNDNHEFWIMVYLFLVPKFSFQRKIIEVYFIKTLTNNFE